MQNNTDPVDEAELPSNVFTATLGQISGGELTELASEKLVELVEVIQDTGKKGKLVLTIEIKPRGRDSGQVEVTGNVKTSLPAHDIAPVMLFAKNGQLVKDNPDQLKLKLGDRPRAIKPASKASNE